MLALKEERPNKHSLQHRVESTYFNVNNKTRVEKFIAKNGIWFACNEMRLESANPV